MLNVVKGEVHNSRVQLSWLLADRRCLPMSRSQESYVVGGLVALASCMGSPESNPLDAGSGERKLGAHGEP